MGNSFWGLHMMECNADSKKTWTTAVHGHVQDESAENNAEWKKPVPKTYILYESMFI